MKIQAILPSVAFGVVALSLRADPAPVYVSASGSDTAPYATHETASTSFAAALQAAVAVPGTTVYVDDGTYALPGIQYVTNGVKVVGLSGHPERCVLDRNGSRYDDSINSCALYIDGADSLVSGVTVARGAMRNPRYDIVGAGVTIGENGGVLSNCVVRGCVFDGYYTPKAVGVFLLGDDALMTRCVVSNNTDQGYNKAIGPGTATGVWLRKGRIEDSLIVGNSSTKDWGATADRSCGVYAEAGSIVNCVIAGNRSYNGVEGLFVPGGASVEVANTVLAGALRANGTAGVSYSGPDIAFNHCALESASAGDVGCVYGTADTFFTDPAAGDYLPPETSRTLNAGDNAAVRSALDLLGADRILYNTVDIGCFESTSAPVSGLVLRFVTESFSALTDQTMALSVSTSAAPGETVVHHWDFGDGTTAETDTLETSHAWAACGTYTVTCWAECGADTSAPASITVEILPRTLYMTVENPNAEAPYATWEKAGTNLAELVDYAIDGCEIVIASGDYRVPGATSLLTTVDKRVDIHSVSGNPADVLFGYLSSVKNASTRFLVLSDPGAVVSGITVTNCVLSATGDNNYTTAGALTQTAGTVSNCCFVGCSTGLTGPPGCALVSGADSLVTHCVFRDCTASTLWQSKGTAVKAQSGARVENCLFVECGSSASGDSDRNDSAVLHLSGGSRAVNCTVYGGSAPGAAHFYGILASGSTVTNCIISGVTNMNGPATWFGDETAFVNCLVDAAEASFALQEDPDDPSVTNLVPRAVSSAPAFFVEPPADTFRDAENGDFRLKTSSKAVNASRDFTPEGWDAPGYTDLAGNPRLLGRLDLGCYECSSLLSTIILLQ